MANNQKYFLKTNMTPETPPPAPNPEEFGAPEKSEQLRETAEADESALRAFEALIKMEDPEAHNKDEAILAEYDSAASKLDKLA